MLPPAVGYRIIEFLPNWAATKKSRMQLQIRSGRKTEYGIAEPTNNKTLASSDHTIYWYEFSVMTGWR